REVTPSKIICIGRNYVEHVKELGDELPDEMVIFMKPNSALSGDLHLFHNEQIHYEGELSFLYEGGAFSALGFGFDLTKRALQRKLLAKGLPWERAKAFDGSAVFSEFVPFSGDFDSLTIRLKIDGLTVQSGGTELMIYKARRYF
ncbi:MAG: fumarylacetoacetate hydrolase family protein, partial [Candidatus Theseobacter exili]|nr:fumarylacetoacetate hydrolase family protein [Candidatus Theseobacter exili]